MNFTSMPTAMMESGLDATWLKMRVHMDNIANYETPNYKAKKISFDEVLSGCGSELHGGRKTGASYQASVWTDDETRARVDGNNVSMEKEQLELFKTQAQYSYLTQKVNGHYVNIRNLISTMSR